MSDVTPEPAGSAQDSAEETPAQADATDWKAEARKWEARAKDNKSALDGLTTEREALVAERDELSGKVADFESAKEREALLADIAGAKGVPASALRGSTRDELEAHADVLADLIKPSAPVVPGQAKAPTKIPDSPEKEAVRSLFGAS